MFNTKNKTDMQQEKTTPGSATLIGAGTTVKGDVNSNNDLRIDGTVLGNITSTAKIIIGDSGVVEGDITGSQADIVGKVTGNIRTRELLQLRGNSVVKGNLFAGKLQLEPTSTFNGECHMGASIVEMLNNEQQAAVK